MKRGVVIVCVFFLMTLFAYGAQENVRKVTGKVLEITTSNIVIQKGKGKMEIARDSSTKVTGEPKIGEKVTVEYNTIAKSIVVQDTKAEKTGKK